MGEAQQQRIVHESEAQRQHIRLPLPAKVEIGGKDYEVRDLSSGGVGVSGISGDFQRGGTVPLRLKLAFGAFSLDVNITAEVQHYNKEEKLLGCQFSNLSGEQISLINHVIKAFLAGDIIASGDLLNIAARDNFVKSRKSGAASAPTSFSYVRQLPGLIAASVIGVAAAVFILSNVYDSVFTLKSTNAAVTGTITQIRAQHEGVLEYTLPADVVTVERGDALATIRGTDGVLTPVESPCSCYVLQLAGANGDYVIPGAPVIALIPTDSTPWVVATVGAEEATSLRNGATATFWVSGWPTEFTGVVGDIKSPLAQSDMATPGVLVKIKPNQKIPVDLAGRPVRVTFSVL